MGADTHVEDACSPTESTTPYCAGPIVQEDLSNLFRPTFFPPKLKLGGASHVDIESLAMSCSAVIGPGELRPDISLLRSPVP